MKGRDHFTAGEAAEIRRLLGLVRRAQPGTAQKRLRDQLRGLGFYITDWRGDQAGFTRSDFDDHVAGGLVRVEGERLRTRVAAAPAAKGGTARDHSSLPSGVAPRPPARLASRPVADEALIDDAHRSLSINPMSIAAAFDGGVPNTAGLYAIYGSAAAWQQLGLGAPPDDRPLYVGKAEASLRSRDLATHFATGRTGQSSPRRSFAALASAAGTLDPQPIPRRPQNPEPGKWTHYALEPTGDEQLTVWLREYVTIAVWEAPPRTALATVERAVMALHLPPLNLTGISTPWIGQVKAARAAMTERAKAWARDRGPLG